MSVLANKTLELLPASILPRLIALFASTTPALIAEIQQHAASGNLLAMAQAAHHLKGSCLSLGAENMAELCTELQHKGEAQDKLGIDDFIAELVTSYPVTLAALQQTQTWMGRLNA